MDFTTEDKKYMKIALEEAKEGCIRGDFPVGAVLTIDRKFIGKAANGNNTVSSLTEHAESRLIETYSATVKKAKREDENTQVTLYTTLEPCLMCLGTSVMGRIDKIIYACPDPNGGTARLNPQELGDWYEVHWPIIEKGLFREEAYEIVTKGMKNDFQRWERILDIFEEMKKKW